jgi:hypothetical protein
MAHPARMTEERTLDYVAAVVVIAVASALSLATGR